MIKPYFQDEHCTIYHGDCREILPQLEPVDLVLTDPPYEQSNAAGGIRSRGGRAINQKKIQEDLSAFSVDDYVDLILGSLSKINIYAFTSKANLREWLNIAEARGLNFDILVLSKRNPIPAKNNCYLPDLEFCVFLRSAGAFFNNAADYDYYRKTKVITVKPSQYGHPTEKPEGRLREMITISTEDGGVVLDPFMGSGTTLAAAKESGRKSIGIEIEEKYCEIAAKRLAQGVLNFG